MVTSWDWGIGNGFVVHGFGFMCRWLRCMDLVWMGVGSILTGAAAVAFASAVVVAVGWLM